MSSVKQTLLNQNQLTALHLYDVAHCLPLNPLNKQYSLNFLDFLVEKSINLPPNPTVTHKFCRNCGVILIPGLTLSLRIVFRKKTKLKKSKESVIRANSSEDFKLKPIRKLRYRCLQCRNLEYDDSLIQRNEKRLSRLEAKESSNEIMIGNSNSVSNSNTPEPFRAEWSPLTNTNEVSKDIKVKSNNNNSKRNSDNITKSNSKSKERSKKRKQNSLSSMLQQKKQQKEQESKTNSLNLMEFMQG